MVMNSREREAAVRNMGKVGHCRVSILWDTGCGVDVISKRVMEKLKIRMESASLGIGFGAYGGNLTASGIVYNLPYSVGEFCEKRSFYVADLNKIDMLLGLPWHVYHNPSIDFHFRRMSFSFNSTMCTFQYPYGRINYKFTGIPSCITEAAPFEEYDYRVDVWGKIGEKTVQIGWDIGSDRDIIATSLVRSLKLKTYYHQKIRLRPFIKTDPYSAEDNDDEDVYTTDYSPYSGDNKKNDDERGLFSTLFASGYKLLWGFIRGVSYLPDITKKDITLESSNKSYLAGDINSRCTGNEDKRNSGPLLKQGRKENNPSYVAAMTSYSADNQDAQLFTREPTYLGDQKNSGPFLKQRRKKKKTKITTHSEKQEVSKVTLTYSIGGFTEEREFNVEPLAEHDLIILGMSWHHDHHPQYDFVAQTLTFRERKTWHRVSYPFGMMESRLQQPFPDEKVRKKVVMNKEVARRDGSLLAFRFISALVLVMLALYFMFYRMHFFEN